jgi:hypothetical protein
LILYNHLAGLPALLLFLLVTLSSMILVEGMRFAVGRYQKLSWELEQRVKDRDAKLNERKEREEKEHFLIAWHHDVISGSLFGSRSSFLSSWRVW